MVDFRRVAMRFSEREGIVKAREVIQSDDIDQPLRNSLWNLTRTFLLVALDNSLDPTSKSEYRTVSRLWLHFFKSPLDEVQQGYWPSERDRIRKWFFDAQWYEVYDFVEFIAQDFDEGLRKNRYLDLANSYLERELSAFRFAGDALTRVATETDLKAIDDALDAADSLPGVRSHLVAATEKLGNRTKPDYRNSIKESISAVEAICQLLAGTQNATLGDAIKKLGTAGVVIHPALSKAWSALYGWTNDKEGIRHAMLGESTVTQADARYMLVSCSAFVSYLVSLAADAKLPLR